MEHNFKFKVQNSQTEEKNNSVSAKTKVKNIVDNMMNLDDFMTQNNKYFIIFIVQTVIEDFDMTL